MALIDKIDGEMVEKKLIFFKSWTPEQREILIERLSPLVSDDEELEIDQLVTDFCYDENVHRRTGMEYSNPDLRLIRCALLDHLYPSI